jgi:hypothetical protein
MYFKVLACEVAMRELCYTAARSVNIVDLEFLTQGHHDTPNRGRVDIQQRLDAIPAAKYDAIVLGYGLCSNILSGLRSLHTQLVVPRAHDCITFFLGSKERYQEHFDANPGTYYYTSGWMECTRRRTAPGQTNVGMLFPAQGGISAAYSQWVTKYGEEKAKALLEVMGEWTANYSRGALIDFDFTRHLKLREQVQQVCGERGWEFTEMAGDIRLFQRLLDGDWRENEVLVVPPGHKIVPAYDVRIIQAEPDDSTGSGA